MNVGFTTEFSVLGFGMVNHRVTDYNSGRVWRRFVLCINFGAVVRFTSRLAGAWRIWIFKGGQGLCQWSDILRDDLTLRTNWRCDWVWVPWGTRRRVTEDHIPRGLAFPFPRLWWWPQIIIFLWRGRRDGRSMQGSHGLLGCQFRRSVRSLYITVGMSRSLYPESRRLAQLIRNFQSRISKVICTYQKQHLHQSSYVTQSEIALVMEK